MTDQHWRKSRHIAERIVVRGTLTLTSPAHFGAGDSEGAADLMILRDGYDGRALLPGASIAGALRSYWRERTLGYGAASGDTALFGAQRGEREDQTQGDQSLLIVEDALGQLPQLELRDGVKIDAATRTAADKHLYDVELLQTGTTFDLTVELLIAEAKPDNLTWAEYDHLPREVRDRRLAERRDALCADLALALQGLSEGEITLGARKRRGFGQCRVADWRVWSYDLTTRDGLLDWLSGDRPAAHEQTGTTLAKKLGVTLPPTDQRDRLELTAEFALESSLLIRSGTGAADQGPDMVHLHRPQLGQAAPEPIVSGTSLAGVLRGRALRIANTLTADPVKARQFVEDLFGVGPQDRRDDRRQASRLSVAEAVIDQSHVHTLIQNRIRVDRFTGGAQDNYLFNEAPVFARGPGGFTLTVQVRQPRDADIGLLLLLLKDLWTGDLPIGGESGIGRGRLTGRMARLKHGATEWSLQQIGEALTVTTTATNVTDGDLERFVTALNDQLAGRVAA